jgi:voltage-gated potassium channel
MALMTKERLRRIIFEADTPAGKLYDVALILAIALSVVCVMLDSVSSVREELGSILYIVEWLFTALFTVDYIIRLRCVERPAKYALSFFGIVDLLSITPTYLSLFIPGSQYLAAIRFLRVLRTFRVLKLSTYQRESQLLVTALRASARRIAVFMFFVLTLVVVLGSLMYVVEGVYVVDGVETGFTSIPRSIYWAVVTLTTVGYGDISPQTGLGQTIAAAVMILGYSIIVIPTGIIAASVSREELASAEARSCPSCSSTGHGIDAAFCRCCGATLPKEV